MALIKENNKGYVDNNFATGTAGALTILSNAAKCYTISITWVPR
jgi:hypothetical protein